jgi:hypothetical protein
MKNILLIILLAITGFTYSQDTTTFYITDAVTVSKLNSNIALGNNVAFGIKKNKFQLGLEYSYYGRKVDNLITNNNDLHFTYQSYSLVGQYDIKQYGNLTLSPSLDLGYTEVALVDRSVQTFFYTENFIRIDKFISLTPGINLSYYNFLFLSAKWRVLFDQNTVGSNISYNTNSNGLLINLGLRIPIKVNIKK